MSAEVLHSSEHDSDAVESWRVAASRAPAIGWRVRLWQLAWTAVVAFGAIPTLAIIKASLLHGYWLGLLNAGMHLTAVTWAVFGASRASWFSAPGQDLLPRRAARATRFTFLRRVLSVEAAALFSIAPIKSLFLGVQLQWGWPATLSVGLFLICFALERIFRAEWREHVRLIEASPLQQ